jgi:hypothetical protein
MHNGICWNFTWTDVGSIITWVVFLRIFWNLSSSLLMKREGSLSFLMIFTFIVPELEALYFMQCHRQILVMSELQIKKNSCQTLGPASKRVLPDLSTFCQTYFFFRNFLIFHFQYSMIKGTILNKGNNKITELRTILQRESQNS